MENAATNIKDWIIISKKILNVVEDGGAYYLAIVTADR